MIVQGPKKEPSTRAMQDWFTEALADHYTHTWARHGLLLGCTVWGAAYIDRFMKYCLPSIFTPENHDTLVGSRALLMIYTDTLGMIMLHDTLAYIERTFKGVDIIVRRISQDVFDTFAVNSNAQYEVLGVAQNLMMKVAARCGAGKHMLMPDHVYPIGYFARLANLTIDHPVILQAGMSAYASHALKPLEKYRNQEGFLLVPPDDLAEIGWRYRHKQSDAHMLKPTEEFPTKWPRSHMVMWQGTDSIQLSCPHLNPIWLSPAICAAARLLPPSTIDAELPQLIGDADTYMATPEDGLSFIELSDDTKGAPRRDMPFAEFARAWWTQVNFRNQYLPLASKLTHIPIRTGPKNGLSDGQITDQHGATLEKLVEIKPQIMQNVLEKIAKYPPVMVGFGVFGDG